MLVRPESPTAALKTSPLIVPSPLPDELDRGYLGTVMRANGISIEAAMDKLLAKWAGMEKQSRYGFSRIELLSKAAGTSLGAFIQNHTTLPLRRAITSYRHDAEHASEVNAKILWHSGMRVTRPGAYFCGECVKEDIGFHGRSYWRRDHQMPGLFWCSKHLCVLRYKVDEKSFLSEPSRFLNDCHTVPEEWLLSKENRAIQAFLAISSALMDRVAPLEVKLVSSVLRRRAAALGLHVNSGKATGPLLSDAVIAAFGRDWLGTVMPKLADKREGELLYQMDGVLFMQNSASSATAYILALAILFEAHEDALNALIYPEQEMSPKCRRSRSPAIEDQALRSAYMRSNGSYQGVSALLGTGYQSIANRLRAAGLPNLNGKRGRLLERAAFAFLRDGMSLSESAKAHGLDIELLEELVRLCGVTLLTTLEEINEHNADRRTGSRRPRRLTPNEVITANGPLATKFARTYRRSRRPTANA